MSQSSRNCHFLENTIKNLCYMYVLYLTSGKFSKDYLLSVQLRIEEINIVIN